jgi:predicted ABC-type ATPase
VPPERLERRFHQSLKNLSAALNFVPDISAYDNTSDTDPFQLVLAIRSGKRMLIADRPPAWLPR